MAVHELNLQALMEDLDGGRVAAAFAAELRRVAIDCDDRPADNKPRKVQLTLALQPVIDPDTGDLDTIKGKFHVTSTVPQRRSKVYDFAYRKGGQLAFNDLSDENFSQRTID